MSGNFAPLVLVLSLLVLLGCAQPKYVSPNSLSDSQAQQENKASCALQFPNSGLCLSWAWEKIPTSTEMGSLVFKTYRLNNYDATAVEMDLPSVPQVILWMPSMGHGSSPTTILRLDVGTYAASNVFFVMPGEWQIKFQLKDGNAVQDEVVISLSI